MITKKIDWKKLSNIDWHTDWLDVIDVINLLIDHQKETDRRVTKIEQNNYVNSLRKPESTVWCECKEQRTGLSKVTFVLGGEWYDRCENCGKPIKPESTVCERCGHNHKEDDYPACDCCNTCTPLPPSDTVRENVAIRLEKVIWIGDNMSWPKIYKLADDILAIVRGK